MISDFRIFLIRSNYLPMDCVRMCWA